MISKMDPKKRWMLTASVFSLISNAPIGVLVAEQLGPEFYSIISSYLLVVSAASMLVYFGLETLLVKILGPLEADKKANVFGAVLLLRTTIFIFLSCGLIFLSPEVILPFLLGATAFDILFFFQQDYEARDDFVLLAKIRILLIVVVSSLRLSFIAADVVNPSYYLMIYNLEKMLFVLFLFIGSPALRKSLSSVRFLFLSDIEWKALARESTYLLASALLFFVLARTDQGILYLNGDKVALANYAISVRLVEAIYFVPVILSNIFMAKISGTELDFEGKRQLVVRETKTLFFLGLILIPIMMLVVFILDRSLLRSFDAFYDISSIYIILLPALFTYNILKKAMVYLDCSKVFFQVMALIAVCHISGSLLIYQVFANVIFLAVMTIASFYITSFILAVIVYGKMGSMRG